MTTPQNTFPSHCILTIFLPSLLFQSCALIFCTISGSVMLSTSSENQMMGIKMSLRPEACLTPSTLFIWRLTWLRIFPPRPFPVFWKNGKKPWLGKTRPNAFGSMTARKTIQVQQNRYFAINVHKNATKVHSKAIQDHKKAIEDNKVTHTRPQKIVVKNITRIWILWNTRFREIFIILLCVSLCARKRCSLLRPFKIWV